LFASSPVKIEYIVIDLGSRKGPLVSVELSKFLEANEVSILINNAGVNTEYPKMFVDNSVSESEAILDVNCRATALMTHAVLPFMLKRNNGLVVNISSLLGQLSGPLVAMYSASKSFVDSFSLSLSEELRGTGVSVFCSTPGFVVSNMSKIKRPSLTVLTPETCARSILQQIAGGWLRIASPSWTHASISWLFRVIVPEFARLRNMGNINRRTNKAALRKK
jgi:17beta-estradiol 17-dehydrogenase / very-long-chain 3-oxoacyl-CoA reductase